MTVVVQDGAPADPAPAEPETVADGAETLELPADLEKKATCLAKCAVVCAVCACCTAPCICLVSCLCPCLCNNKA
jgi:hypothetical protein